MNSILQFLNLGTIGTVMFIASAALNVWQLYKGKNVERLTNALQTTETEMRVYKSRAERQSQELKAVHQQLGDAKAKTDLSTVLIMLSETVALTRESVDLSRKFELDNSQTNLSIANILEKHGDSDKQIFSQIEESLKSQVEATKELNKSIREHREEARAAFSGMLESLKRGNGTRTRSSD